MLSEDKYYSINPIKKKVTKEEFNEFLNKYPRRLTCDVCGISDPPAISYNDFKLADRWPYSIVANTWAYDDDPNGYFYEPEEKRDYYIVENYEEVFNSRTGINTSKYEEKERQASTSGKQYFIKEITEVKLVNRESGDTLCTFEIKDSTLENHTNIK
jgi:hypothetical protein